MKKYSIRDVEQLTPEDLNKKNKEELKQIIKTGAKSVNQRLTILENKDLTSPGLLATKKTIEDLLPGKDRYILSEITEYKSFNQLRRIANLIIDQLNYKTLTVTSARELKEKTIQRIANISGVDAKNINWTSDTMSAYWDTYNTILYMFGGKISIDYDSERLQRSVREYMRTFNSSYDLKNMSADEIRDSFQKFIGESPEYRNFKKLQVPGNPTQASIDYWEGKRSKWNTTNIKLKDL